MTSGLEVYPAISAETVWWVGAVLVAYLVGVFSVALWARRRIFDAEDFIVAGRRLSLGFATAALMGTWFGAATILTAADEVRLGGLRQIALEPLGSGFCLILAGFFFAARLWKMKLLTLPDFFRDRFGTRTEVLSACIMVPSFFGWIAVQFIALAEMMHLFFGLDVHIGILLVALVGGGYTYLGGMWSVTMTDAIQIILILLGIVFLGVATLGFLGDGSAVAGFGRLLEETPPEMLVVVPTETLEALLGWVGVFCIAALGNIASQDLLQRIFSARSASVARRACWISGVAYVGFGLIPVMLGLASTLLFPEDLQRAILPALAHAFLAPVPAVIFTLALTSAILSTIDSAILAPASVLSQNLFGRFWKKTSTLALTRLAVVLVTLFSMAAAYLGESAYDLLEDAYALPLVGLLVPLTLGLYRRPRHESSALAVMGIGTGLWLLHYVLDWDSFLEPLARHAPLQLPVAITIALIGLLLYLILENREATND
jgi:solute:Na+ symporter, SSS family